MPRFGRAFIGGLTTEQVLWRDLQPLLQAGQRLLDAGCGSGRLARRIAMLEPEMRLTLLDLSPKMLGLAANVPGHRVRGSVLELPFRDAQFDLVVSNGVLQNVPDREEALSELVRVLTPGGRLLYTDCTLPPNRLLRIASAIPRFIVGRSFGGRFRSELATPAGCHELHRYRGRRQMAVEVALVKPT